MRHNLRVLGPLIFALIPGRALAQPPAAKPDPVIEQLVEAHNQARAGEKLPPLKLEALLTKAAEVQSRDMAGRERMGHDGTDGSTPEQRVKRIGYHYQRTGENVAMGYRDVPQVIQAWMDSPGHRKNILGDFTEIGLAKVVGEDGKPYWTAEFGTPMPKFDPAEATKDLIRRINDERTAIKLPKLVLDEALAKASQNQATALASKRAEGAGTPNFDGIDAKDYSDLATSTASGHPDAETMARLIFERPPMREQALGKFTRIGAGYATAEDGLPYWCLILGTPARKSTR